MKSTELLESVAQRILSVRIQARHLLMDSWFAILATKALLSTRMSDINMVNLFQPKVVRIF